MLLSNDTLSRLDLCMDRESLIQKTHASPGLLVVAVTGGGATAISDWTATPGASATLLEAVVPYATQSIDHWLGYAPESYCCERTARLLAMRAYLRAVELTEDETDVPLIGCACTASLASTRPKRGEHRAHIAIQSEERTTVCSITFEKGRRTRTEEDRIVADQILIMAALAKGVDAPSDFVGSETERLETKEAVASDALRNLFRGTILGIRVKAGPNFTTETACMSDVEQDANASPLLFPGSYRPMHRGHRGMIEAAQRLTGRSVELEMSIGNVDKPPLDFLEIEHRIQNIDAGMPVWLTHTPTFEEKSTLFPGATFIVGTDTIRRIGDPSYYGDMKKRLAAIDRIAERGCRFLVFGRQSSCDETFESLSSIKLPPTLQAICDEAPESVFREDVSSTEIRKGEKP